MITSMLQWTVICLLLSRACGTVMEANSTTGIYTATKIAENNTKTAILGTTQATDDIECTRKCGRTDGCMSFVYNRNSQSCQMHWSGLYNWLAASFTDDPGYWFYRMTRRRQPIDCYDILLEGGDVSGEYTIYLDGVPEPVYCDQETDEGGWMVFQRRSDGSVDFERGWTDYEDGFGNSSEFWKGNKFLANFATQREYILRVDLESFENETRFAVYGTFGYGNASANYTLHVDEFSGTAGPYFGEICHFLSILKMPAVSAVHVGVNDWSMDRVSEWLDSCSLGDLTHNFQGDSLDRHSEKMFSTMDQDNDPAAGNCAKDYRGGWWHTGCHNSHLNGVYLYGNVTQYAQGINWSGWKGKMYSLKSSEMKLRPKNV